MPTQDYWQQLLLQNDEPPRQYVSDRAAIESLAITAVPRLSFTALSWLRAYQQSPLMTGYLYQPACMSLVADPRLLSARAQRPIANPFPPDKFYPPSSSSSARGLAARLADGGQAMLAALYRYALGIE